MTLRKEREVTAVIDRYLDIVKALLKVAAEAVESYLKGDVATARVLAIKLSGLRAEIENYRYDAWDKLSRGAFLPLIRVDLLALVNHIAAVTEAAEACCETFLLQKPEIPSGMLHEFSAMAEAAFKFFPPINDSVLHYLKGADILGVVNRNREEICKLKVRRDDLQRHLREKIYAPGLECRQRAAMGACVRSIRAVSDHALRTFEQIQLITIKL